MYICIHMRVCLLFESVVVCSVTQNLFCDTAQRHTTQYTTKIPHMAGMRVCVRECRVKALWYVAFCEKCCGMCNTQNTTHKKTQRTKTLSHGCCVLCRVKVLRYVQHAKHVLCVVLWYVAFCESVAVCVTYSTQHATRNTQHATRNTQHTTRNTQHATRNTQHTTHNTQHTTHNTQEQQAICNA